MEQASTCHTSRMGTYTYKRDCLCIIVNHDHSLKQLVDGGKVPDEDMTAASTSSILIVLNFTLQLLQ